MLDPARYDYVWTDHDVNFIFTSCYLFDEFRKSDMVLMYDWKKKGLSFFLGKKDRKRLENEGAAFYSSQSKFNTWKSSIIKEIAHGKKLIAESAHDKPAKVSNHEIEKRFLERVQCFQRLASLYWHTEFFYAEKAEHIAQKNKRIKTRLWEMGKFKMQARNVLNSFYNYRIIFKPYIEEISQRTKRADLPWLSFDEIIAVLNGKHVTATKKDEMNWILAKEFNWKILLRNQAEPIKSKFDSHFFGKKRTIVKGICANKGRHIGIAKVMRTIFSDNVLKEIKKVKKGDVLIANTTGPELMAALQKAGAIVTDEGGLTSHAAVVARELGIPCIVGTKMATHVFRDGEMVEVDADKGIVRKI